MTKCRQLKGLEVLLCSLYSRWRSNLYSQGNLGCSSFCIKAVAIRLSELHLQRAFGDYKGC